MPTTVQHDRDHNQLHLIFCERLIARTEWFAPEATIGLASDGTPVTITIYGYYTRRIWPLTEETVEVYGLKEHLEDLRLVWQAFFAPSQYAVKAIHYEGPDGNEIIIPGAGSELAD